MLGMTIRQGSSLQALVGFFLLITLSFMPEIGNCQDLQRQMLGFNKIELMEQYLGTASGGDGSAKYKEVTVPMARKAVEDAAYMGATFLRVGVTGFWPNQHGQKSDLDLWQRDPLAYWKVMDAMIDDLSEQNLALVPLFVWNISQFSAITGESYAVFLRDPNSMSYQLLERYVREFVSRYKTHRSILFYELANEFNLPVDIDVEARCAKKKSVALCANPENIVTSDVIAFLTRLAALIRSIDGAHKISSGLSINRPAAEHLRRLPEWLNDKASWKLDDFSEFTQNMRDMNSMVDIISVHLYPIRENRRFGISAGNESHLLEYVKRAADQIGKPVFVGEFGEFDSMRAAVRGGFTDQFMQELVRLKIPYAALWGLEFYPKPYYEQLSRQELGSVEFGYSDFVVRRFMETAAEMGQRIGQVERNDMKPPLLVLTWPLECAVINHEQLIYAVASDNSLNVNRVEFWINDRKITSVMQPPYQTKFDPDDFLVGVHSIEARAYDAAGNESASKRRVVISHGAKSAPIQCR